MSRHPEPDARLAAAQMLMAASRPMPMDLHDALIVVDAMRPLVIDEGAVLMTEHQTDEVDYMALVVRGQVRAESHPAHVDTDVVISIIEPGQLIGEMGLLDGEPRSATCTALTELHLAVLTRSALEGLFDVQPGVAARVLQVVAHSLAERLRESNRRLRTLSRVMRAMQHELDVTHQMNQTLLDRR